MARCACRTPPLDRKVTAFVVLVVPEGHHNNASRFDASTIVPYTTLAAGSFTVTAVNPEISRITVMRDVSGFSAGPALVFAAPTE